jgi:O-antigen ligase
VWPLARFERVLVHGCVFLLPLAVWWSTYDQYVLPKLLLARVLLIGMAVLFAARAISTGQLIVRRTPLDIPILAFLASAVLSTAFAVNVNVAVFGIYTRYDGLLTLATYAGVFWFAVQTLEGPAGARALLRTMLASGYAVAALAIVQAAGDLVSQQASIHAFGTLGQWNILGGFLAMLWPVALIELVVATRPGARLLAANVLVVLLLALILTFSRSAWLGSAAGLLVLLMAGSRQTRRAGVALLAMAAALAVAIALSASGGFELARSLEARALSLFDPSDPRLAIWRDTIPLILNRPLIGFGPDTFGLVFPRFNTVYYIEPIDKAHAEVLQIAATQGLLGLAAYGWVVVSVVRAFLRRRGTAVAAAVFAGWVGYEVALQVNFTALASAMPFWMFLAAGFATWEATTTRSLVLRSHLLRTTAGVAVAVAACLAIGIVVVLPYAADSALLNAVTADFGGRPAAAAPDAALALRLDPRESVYAVEVGNIAFERGDWAEARIAYGQAIELGTYNTAVYRNLAIADRNLGLEEEARIAAEGAYDLNPFDPANRALLAQFASSGT